MSKAVVAGLKAGPLICWIGAIVGVGAYVLVDTLTGDGLENTIFFSLFGYGIYPLFYALLAFGVWDFTQMFLRRADYISVDGELLTAGRKTVAINEIAQVYRRPGLTTDLVIQLRNRSEIVVKCYMLRTPPEQVARELRSLLFKASPTMN